MTIDTKPSSLGAFSLFGRAREAIIGQLFSDEGCRLHGREIARRTGLSAQSIHAELRQLERAGLVRSEGLSHIRLFSANPDHPLHDDLRSIARKTSGVGSRLRRFLADAKGIDLAFVFGSVAKGTARANSDIDLIAIGEMDYAKFSVLLSRAGQELGRAVDAKLYRREEWGIKRAEGNSFVVTVLKEPKLFVKGNQEALDAAGQLEESRAAAPDRGAGARQGRDRASPGPRPGVSRRVAKGRAS